MGSLSGLEGERERAVCHAPRECGPGGDRLETRGSAQVHAKRRVRVRKIERRDEMSPARKGNDDDKGILVDCLKLYKHAAGKVKPRAGCKGVAKKECGPRGGRFLFRKAPVEHGLPVEQAESGQTDRKRLREMDEPSLPLTGAFGDRAVAVLLAGNPSRPGRPGVCPSPSGRPRALFGQGCRKGKAACLHVLQAFKKICEPAGIARFDGPSHSLRKPRGLDEIRDLESIPGPVDGSRIESQAPAAATPHHGGKLAQGRFGGLVGIWRRAGSRFVEAGQSRDVETGQGLAQDASGTQGRGQQ